MIKLDPRDGSGPLVGPLRERGLEVDDTVQLPAGDLELIGRGPDDCPVLVGVEIKKVGEFLSSIYSGRFKDVQAPRLIKRFEYKYLLIEGRTRRGQDGWLEIEHRYGWYEPKGGRTKHRVYRRMLMSIQAQTPIIVVTTENQDDTADWIADLAAWWRTAWGSHNTLAGSACHQQIGLHLQLVEPTVVQLWAAALPDIGAEKATAAAGVFESPLDLATASERRWASIRGIGKTIAESAYRIIRSKS